MKPIVRRLSYLGIAAGLIVAGAFWAHAQEQAYEFFPRIDFDHPAIQYQTRPTSDLVNRLQKQIDKGEVKLDYDDIYGYLPSLLKHLGVNRDSQMLVFSKTSFQGAENRAQESASVVLQ